VAGGVSHCQGAWQGITNDPWVLEVAKQYHLKLVAQTAQSALVPSAATADRKTADRKGASPEEGSGVSGSIRGEQNFLCLQEGWVILTSVQPVASELLT